MTTTSGSPRNAATGGQPNNAGIPRYTRPSEAALKSPVPMDPEEFPVNGQPTPKAVQDVIEEFGGEREAVGRLLAERWADKAEEERYRCQKERQYRVEAEVRERLAAESAPPGSWARIDPAEALKSAAHIREPEVGYWANDPCPGVFYMGRINDVHGESESGKSWLVLAVVAQEIRRGRQVGYVDFEDEAGEVYRRLILLGVSEDELRGDQFLYFNPNGSLKRERVGFMAAVQDASTVVFDGVSEAMALEDLSARDETDVAKWHARATRDLAHRDGKCVVVIDHVPHGGDRAIGSQHKRAAITGVSYLVETGGREPIGRGVRGSARVKVDKDKPGAVRVWASPGKRPQYRGELVIDFAVTPPTFAFVGTATASDVERSGVGMDDMAPSEDLIRAVTGYVAANPGASLRGIRGGVRQHFQQAHARISNGDIDWTIEFCLGNRYLRVEVGGVGRSNSHFIDQSYPRSPEGEG